MIGRQGPAGVMTNQEKTCAAPLLPYPQYLPVSICYYISSKGNRFFCLFSTNFIYISYIFELWLNYYDFLKVGWFSLPCLGVPDCRKFKFFSSLLIGRKNYFHMTARWRVAENHPNAPCSGDAPEAPEGSVKGCTRVCVFI